MALESTRIREWLIKTIEEIHSDGLVRDAHIDQFVTYRTDDQQETFQNACLIINLVAKILKNYDTRGIGVYLHLDLISNSKVLKKAPKDLTKLVGLIDVHCVPEVIIYKPVESVSVPSNEFYRVPIQFEMDLLENDLIVLYKAWRTYSEEQFQREINFIVTANN